MNTNTNAFMSRIFEWLQKEYLTIFGLLLTLLGAAIAAYGVWVTPEQAIEIGVMRINGNTPAEDLQLPAVQNFLFASKMAVRGFELIAVGTFFQLWASFRKG